MPCRFIDARWPPRRACGRCCFSPTTTQSKEVPSAHWPFATPGSPVLAQSLEREMKTRIAVHVGLALAVACSLLLSAALHAPAFGQSEEVYIIGTQAPPIVEVRADQNVVLGARWGLVPEALPRLGPRSQTSTTRSMAHHYSLHRTIVIAIGVDLCPSSGGRQPASTG